MNIRLRKILLLLAGQTGTHLVSLIILLSVLKISGYTGNNILEIVLWLTLIRSIFFLTRGPKPVLASYLVRKRVLRVIEDEFKIAIAVMAVCYVMKWQVTLSLISLYLVINGLAQIGLMYLSKVILKSLSQIKGENSKAGNNKQVIIIGTGTKAKKAADVILNSPEYETTLAGFLDYHKKGLWRYRDIPLIGHPDEISGIINHCQVDAVIVAVEVEDIALTKSLFSTVEKMGVPIYFMPVIFDPKISRIRPAYINGTPVLLYRAVPENQLLLISKNIVDKIGALCGMLLALPLLILAAVAIKLDSKGPVFFKQTRSGLNGKIFKLYKLRTMHRDAEQKKRELLRFNEMSGPVFKLKNDPRVTGIGRFLRKTSMDEIPQFINVLKGDMSLVGPRPPLPDEVAQYEPWQRRRLSVKPGITCIWQVNGRNNVDFDEWLHLDMEYIDNWSLWKDTKILAKTIPTVIKGSGAS